VEQLERDKVESKQNLLEPSRKRQKIPYEELQDVSNVIDINSDGLRGQMKECYTALSKSVTNRQSSWNILNITPATLNSLKGIRANAIVKANSLEKHQCQQMSQDYLKVLALTSQETDVCNMGYVDRDGGQFTVARRVPGGDQVMGSLSLALSLMNCIEIQNLKTEQRKKELMMIQRIENLENTTLTKQQRLEDDSIQHLTNMAVGSVEMEGDEDKADGKDHRKRSITNISFHQPDWTCIQVDSVPCVILEGIPYSSIHNLSEKNDFDKIHQYFRRKRTVHCITNDMINWKHKENVMQHLDIRDGQQNFKLYKKSAVDNFLAEP
jgi:ATP/maltotriose-dependent transcriptional regulator MalT